MNGTMHCLQLLRAIAAYLVVSMHTSQAISTIMNNKPHDYWGAGSFGVDLFFVISGFVMERLAKDNLGSKLYIRVAEAKKFMQRRLIRVVPMYWIFTSLKVAILTLLPVLATRTTLESSHIFSSYMFLPHLAPWGLIEPVLPVGWTLNFEMFFYIIFAFALLISNHRAMIVLVVFLSINFANFAFDTIPLQFYSRDIVFEFLVGIFIAKLDKKENVQSPLYGVISISIGLIILIFNLDFLDGSHFLRFGIAAGLIVYGSICLEEYIRRIPKVIWVSKVGDASYTTYLFHPFVIPAIILLMIKVGVSNHVVIFLMCLVITAIGSQLVHNYFELPLTKRLKSLISPTRALPL